MNSISIKLSKPSLDELDRLIKVFAKEDDFENEVNYDSDDSLFSIESSIDDESELSSESELSDDFSPSPNYKSGRKVIPRSTLNNVVKVSNRSKKYRLKPFDKTAYALINKICSGSMKKEYTALEEKKRKAIQKDLYKGTFRFICDNYETSGKIKKLPYDSGKYLIAIYKEFETNVLANQSVYKFKQLVVQFRLAMAEKFKCTYDALGPRTFYNNREKINRL
uniref:Transcription factor n=1 Tax=Parastrongyloides trichosuri TaxID=131310 RepID=A0A0N4ZED1_PARTI